MILKRFLHIFICMVYDQILKLFLHIEASFHAIACYAMFDLNALEYIEFVFLPL